MLPRSQWRARRFSTPVRSTVRVPVSTALNQVQCSRVDTKSQHHHFRTLTPMASRLPMEASLPRPRRLSHQLTLRRLRFKDCRSRSRVGSEASRYKEDDNGHRRMLRTVQLGLINRKPQSGPYGPPVASFRGPRLVAGFLRKTAASFPAASRSDSSTKCAYTPRVVAAFA